MITIDPEVVRLRNDAAAKRKDLEAAAEAARARAADLVTLPDAATLQKAREAAEKKRNTALADFQSANGAVAKASDDYERAHDDLTSMRTHLSVLETLLWIIDKNQGPLPASFRNAIDPGLTDLAKGIDAEIRKTKAQITKQETVVKNLADQLHDARMEAAKADHAWRVAEDKLDDTFEQERRRTQIETDKTSWTTRATKTKGELDDIQKRLRDARSNRALLERYPVTVPDYLKITVGTTPVEPSADAVLRELAAKHPAFQPHLHTGKLANLVSNLGINGDLIAVVDQLNRGKDKPVKRRILAATYAYTVFTLLKKIKAEVKHDDKVRDAVKDRTGMVNRIRDFQRQGVSGIEAPQVTFAEKFIDEVAKRKRVQLPTSANARKELHAKILTNL